MLYWNSVSGILVLSLGDFLSHKRISKKKEIYALKVQMCSGNTSVTSAIALPH